MNCVRCAGELVDGDLVVEVQKVTDDPMTAQQFVYVGPAHLVCPEPAE